MLVSAVTVGMLALGSGAAFQVSVATPISIGVSVCPEPCAQRTALALSFDVDALWLFRQHNMLWGVRGSFRADSFQEFVPAFGVSSMFLLNSWIGIGLSTLFAVRTNATTEPAMGGVFRVSATFRNIGRSYAHRWSEMFGAPLGIYAEVRAFADPEHPIDFALGFELDPMAIPVYVERGRRRSYYGVSLLR